MSVGYIVTTVIFFVLALIVCLLAYRYYTKVSIKKMPINCAIWHVIALYMCVLPFPLLVVDIDAALYKRDHPSASSQTWMAPIWRSIFAITYLCAWVTLPLAQMYTEVGSFEWKKAFMASLKLNLKLYAIIIVVVLIFFVYILIIKGAYTSLTSVLKIGISLANAWGLLILTLFMPAGLVGVPRMLWRYADAKRLLRRQLFDATNIQEDLDLAALDLASVKAELISIDPTVSEENRPHLTRMLELISEADREIPLYHAAAMRVRAAPSNDRNDISLEHLEELHAKLKRALKVINRANYRWTSTVRKCSSLDEIVRGVKETSSPIKKYWFPIRKYVYLTGCGVCSILTLLILWSELVLPFQRLTTTPLGVIQLVMSSPIHFIGSVVLLFYMAYCAYWAAFQFKVFDVYVVYPSIADNASLCFNETFLVRLLMPLCFNFLLISGLSDTSTGVDVMYGHVYRRNMDISLLFGDWFNRFLPMLIPFLSGIVFFNLTQKVLSYVGVEVNNPNDVDSPAVQQRINDGRRLVEAELGYALESSLLPGESSADLAARMSPSSSARNSTLAPSKGGRYKEYLAKKRMAEGAADDSATPRNENDTV